MTRLIITGAPGTGKTALIASLSHLGDRMAEPARELIAEHREATGEPSLDRRPERFVELLVARSIRKHSAAEEGAVTFYDRGLPDCVGYARILGVDASEALEACFVRRYENPVFMAPPWEAIYTTDDMRRATFAQVEAFHEALVAAYVQLGYQLVELPRTSISDRADFVASVLGHEGGSVRA